MQLSIARGPNAKLNNVRPDLGTHNSNVGGARGIHECSLPYPLIVIGCKKRSLHDGAKLHQCRHYSN